MSPERRILTAPNILSISRVPLAIAAALTLAHHRWISMTCVLLACLTDFLDGQVARRTGSVSDIGKILDPIADKLAFVIFALAATLAGRLPGWLLPALAAREIVILAGGVLLLHRSRRAGGRMPVPSSNLAGKLSTLLLALYLAKQVFWPARPVLAGLDWLGIAAMFFLLLSSLVYSLRLLGRSSGRGATQRAGGEGSCT